MSEPNVPIKLMRAASKHTQFLYELYADRQVQAGHGMHHAITGPQWRQIVQGLLDGWQHVYLIMLGDVPVGHVAFQDWSQEDRRAEVSVTVNPAVTRQGIGTEALRQLLEQGKRRIPDGGLGLVCVYATTPSYNTACQRVLEKNGFKLSGSIDNFYRYQGARHAKNIYVLA